MEYYIKEGNWKQILEFIKGIHSKDEKRLRVFVEADSEKWLPVAIFTKNLR